MGHMFIVKSNTSTYDPNGVEQNGRFIFFKREILSGLKKSQAMSRPRMGHMFIEKSNTSTYDPNGVEQNERFIFHKREIPS